MAAAGVIAGRERWCVIEGDALEASRSLPSGSFQTCVTSPPYWGGVRDYGEPGQLGLERRPEDYVSAQSAVFLEVRRLLSPTGCLWLNVGDVYAASGKDGGGSAGKRGSWDTVRDRKGFRMPPDGYKMKDLTLVAFQLADRPSVSHEYLFLFSVSEVYQAFDPGEPWWGSSVWGIPSSGKSWHPADFPEELVRRCLISSTKPGDLVLDPYAGSGTTQLVARRLGCRSVGIELNADYVGRARRRVGDEAVLFAEKEFLEVPADAGLFDHVDAPAAGREGE
jgi:site-specific DNA-methyltransferase (cytosine-N4-specific)